MATTTSTNEFKLGDVHKNRLVAIPILLGIVAAEAFAQTCLKTSLKQTKTRKILYITFGVMAYMVVAGLLVAAYKFVPFSLTNSIWSVLSIIAIVSVGVVFFKDKIPMHDWVALAFMIVGLIIIFFVDGNDDPSSEPKDFLFSKFSFS